MALLFEITPPAALSNIYFFDNSILISEAATRGVLLKSFAIFTGKHLCWSIFLIKALRPATLPKKDSNTGVFL